MNYEEAMAVIGGRLRFGSKLGIERMELLMHKLGDPQKKLKFVHVAGTNGKGTTCTYISSVLSKAGYRTGLYTSPYVVDFRERFCIDGEMISKEELAAMVEKVSQAAEEISYGDDDITEFEFITALAFCWYHERNCDVVVLEVGLGGRFDATNIIEAPLAAVIASISLDHTAILGDSIEKIAFEKAGIIKPGTAVSLYPDMNPEALKLLKEISSERNVPVSVPEKPAIKKTDIFGTDFTYLGKNYHIGFMGEHQALNAVNALNAIEILRSKGFTISYEDEFSGLESSFIEARMEIVSQKPLVIIDGGHNPECGEALKKVMEQDLAGHRINAVMGMMADKDSMTYLSLVAPHFSKIFTLMPDNPRSLSAEELAEEAGNFCADVKACASVSEAAKAAVSSLSREDVLIVCGSFYYAGEIRKKIKEILG